MDKILIDIKKKREFSGLPNSIIERVAKFTGGEIKESRALLRKYFGVFLTNKILKGKLSPDEMLTNHRSSKKRDYRKFYRKIFSEIESVDSVIDLGCGVNGLSYKYLREVVGNVDYVGVEAAGQLVEYTNKYFDNEGFSAKVISGDLFDVEKILKILKKQKKKRIVFLFQIVDVLENLERGFLEKFVLEISKECEKIVLSFPVESLSGRKLVAQRKWLVEFLKNNFIIEKDFLINGERIFVLGKK